MAGRAAKVSLDEWIATARRALIEEGVEGLKVERLADRLGVTRGGFYHQLESREALVERLLGEWRGACRMMHPVPPAAGPRDAASWLDESTRRLIEEDGYDPAFDMAVREWSRSEPRAALAVRSADRERIGTLTRIFVVLGYGKREARIRARVLYYHQIGYYAIGVRESRRTRRRSAPVYLDILCGAERLAAARRTTSRAHPAPRAA